MMKQQADSGSWGDSVTEKALYDKATSLFYASHDGTRLHCLDHGGPGEPVILLHGLESNCRHWGGLDLGLVREGYRVLALDQRGHGSSAKPPSGYRPADMAADVAALDGHAGLASVSLVGYSMGARVAYVTAALYPSLVRRLVVIDIGPEVQPGEAEELRRFFEAAPVPFPDAETARAYFEQYFGPERQVAVDYLMATLMPASGGLTWSFSPAAMVQIVREGREVDTWDLWRAVRCPTLLLRGTNSHELPPDVARRMLELKPDTTFVEIPGTGHGLIYQKPRDVLEAITRFLAAR